MQLLFINQPNFHLKKSLKYLTYIYLFITKCLNRINTDNFNDIRMVFMPMFLKGNLFQQMPIRKCKNVYNIIKFITNKMNDWSRNSVVTHYNVRNINSRYDLLLIIIC